MEDKGNKFRIRSEKLINESWSFMDDHFEDLVKIANKESIDNEHDEAVALTAINVIIQNIVLHRAEDEYHFGDNTLSEALLNIGLAPCGRTTPCVRGSQFCRDKCFFFSSDNVDNLKE